MVLSDLGADVVRIERDGERPEKPTATDRGRAVVQLNLKVQENVEVALKLCALADAIIEGYRPGVMERLGLGPERMFEHNPKLVYARMTGWGQSGPLSQSAGHDINFIAISGALAAIGTKSSPIIPLNLVGDYGGGSLFLVISLLAAVFEAKISGKGQIVDTAMCDGAAYLSSDLYSMTNTGAWSEIRADNLIDGGAHFYNTFECADGKFISVGAVEPRFFTILQKSLAVEAASQPPQYDKSSWASQKEKFRDIFIQRTRDEWCKLLEGTEACFAPVLTVSEAPFHPQYRERNFFVDLDGVVQPGPVPRYSRTECIVRPRIHSDFAEVLKRWK
jgi:alpha-methylacyl-CoA racemase